LNRINTLERYSTLLRMYFAINVMAAVLWI